MVNQPTVSRVAKLLSTYLGGEAVALILVNEILTIPDMDKATHDLFERIRREFQGSASSAPPLPATGHWKNKGTKSW